MKIVVLLCFSFASLVGCSSNTDKIKSDEVVTSETEAQDQFAQINSENALSILGHVASIVNEDPIEAFMQNWHAPFGGAGHWIDFRANGVDDTLQIVDSGDLLAPITLNFVDYWEESVTRDATEFVDYACTNGGSVKQLLVPNIVNSHLLDDCASLAGTYSGEALRMISHHRPFIAIGHYNNLMFIDSQQKNSTLSGRFRDGGNQNFVGERYTPTWIDVEFNSSLNHEPFSLTRFNLARDEVYANPSSFDMGFFEASVTADFGVTAQWSQQMEISVSVDLSLSDDAGLPTSFDWDKGSVVIIAADDSSMTIAVDSAKPSEFHILLGSDESIGPYRWSDGYRFQLSRHWD